MSDNYSNSITNTSAVKKVLGVAIIVTLSFVIFISYITEIDYTRGELELFTSFNFIVLSIVLAYTLPRGIWSISFIFFVTFGIFHAGLILASSINAITDEDILYQISFWFHHGAGGLGFLPTTEDTITYDGVVWKVVEVSPTYSAATLIASKITCRAA